MKDQERKNVHFFTRHGGKSVPPFASLNVSFHVGDDADSVVQNREIIKKQLGVDVLISARQVHGKEVFWLTESLATDMEIDGYDAIITDQKNVGVLIQQADCQAVMLYDPTVQLVAGIHCGWRGSVQNIIGLTVQEMIIRKKVNPAHLQAAISPSLGPCCAEFKNYARELPESFYPFKTENNHFDFWQISIRQLIECGVEENNITVAGICTSCNKDYFSYRRAQRHQQTETGRNCSVIVLR